MLWNKIINWLQRHLFVSFKATINIFYISTIIILVSITGAVSFSLATQQVEENTYESVNDTVQQTTNYLDFIFNDVFEQLVSLSNDPKIASLIYTGGKDVSPKEYINIDDELKSIYHRNSSIIQSIYMNINEEFIIFKGSQQQLDPYVTYDHYFKEFTNSKESYYWRNLHQNDFFLSDEQVISVFKLIGTPESASQGIILFHLNPDAIAKAFNNLAIGENGYLTLRSPDGSFSLKEVSNDYQLDQSSQDFLNETDKQNGKFSFKSQTGNEMIAIYNTIGVNDWKVVAVIPEKELLNKVNYIKYFTIIFLILIILIGTILVNYIGKFISKPIIKLAKTMETADQENFDAYTGFAVPQEMKILHESFNDLMVRNHDLLEEIKAKQKEVRQLEVGIIQAQMSPHFLYNTLYSIKGLCDMEESEEASKMISELASFFRVSISKGEEVITISEEIKHIRSYLYIMEMRYGDQFTYSIHGEEEILSSMIIKLTLQPLIENAIYHGVKEKRGGGQINVNMFQKDKNIYLVVEDNGLGIESRKLEKIKQELEATYRNGRNQMIGIGLKSVHERIRNYFGNEYGIQIESEIGKGTKVTIMIPQSKGRNSEDA